MLATPLIRWKINEFRGCRTSLQLPGVAVPRALTPPVSTRFDQPHAVFVDRAAPMPSKSVVSVLVTLVRALQGLLRPARFMAHLVIGAARDLTSTRSELLVENAMLRQQIIVLRPSLLNEKAEKHDEK